MTESRPDIITSQTTDTPSSLLQPEWLTQRLEWFQDLKFGLFVHWGVYSQWGCIESWPLVEVDTWARPDTTSLNPAGGVHFFRRQFSVPLASMGRASLMQGNSLWMSATLTRPAPAMLEVPRPAGFQPLKDCERAQDIR